jgi:signal recognition particle subunit SRP54
MGNMKDLVGMIPGASKGDEDVEIEDDAFKHIEAGLLFDDSNRTEAIS